ncbi:MAG: FAD-binding protein [Flexilinea sp.]
MAGIVVHPEKISSLLSLEEICPFGAIEIHSDGTVQINAACRLCKACVRNGPNGAFEFREEVISASNKAEWQGITVYGEIRPDNRVHPVVYELLGKARELADIVGFKISLLLIGSDIRQNTMEFFHFGADKIYCFDDPILKYFDIERYTTIFESYISEQKPSVILVGGTPLGRSLAPRVAARVKTGLTADCTQLEIQPTTDLDQIRPAFGGNIMAHIRTPYHRPQFATVRYKIFSALEPDLSRTGEIITCDLPKGLSSRSRQIETGIKPKVRNIEDMDVLVVAGRGIRKKEDLELLRRLAYRLGGELACTRPLIESGWLDARKQIGLSGRTVKPKLLIACGISGSVQFAAGMKSSEIIISINIDPEAAINQIANIAIIGDLYTVIPALLEKLA